MCSFQKHLIHRVIFAAKIKSTVTERREIGGLTSKVDFNTIVDIKLIYILYHLGGYERLFKQLHSQIQGETFTGLLLIYPSHIVHIVEVDTNNFNKKFNVAFQ